MVANIEAGLQALCQFVAETFCNSTSFGGHITEEARLKENKWHTHATKLMEKDTLDQTDAVAWSAYHASTQQRGR